MATPNIVPRADSEGGLGTASKYWGSAYIDAITTTGNVTVGGVLQVEASSSPNFQLYRSGTGQLWNFSVDSSGRIQLKEAASLGGTKNTRLQIDDDGQVDITSGALTISSDGANAATLTESASGDFTIASVDDLRLETGGNDIVLKGASSVEYGRLTNDSGTLNIQNTTEDKDIKFEVKNTTEGTETYLIIDGSARTVNFSRHTFQPDGIETRIGTGNDLKIVHDGANSNIENNTGALFLLNREADGDIIFKSDDGSGSAITEYFRVDGGEGRLVHTANSRYLDNAVVMIGSSGDLQIKHDGSHSYISQGGTGNLYIQQNVNSADLMFQCDDGNGNTTTYFYLDGSSATHDGSVTTGLFTNWPDKSNISLGTSHDLRIYHDGSNSYIQNETGNLNIFCRDADKDIVFFADNGSGSGTKEYFRLDGSALVTNFPDNSKLTIGAGNDLQMYHDGSNSFIDNITGIFRITQSVASGDLVLRADNGSGSPTPYITLDGGDVSTIINTIKVLMPNLPASDPTTAGQLWNDSGTLKISAG
tara:strand:+ start:1451 stop:3052 length:1602 start_codon:yes stop_codon:yes gene_type:complete